MHCYFCQKNKREVDFRDVQSLSFFISASGKIKAKKKTGLCSFHQRRVSEAIKRARFLALLPFVKE